MSDLLKEAIADAKAVRETALENAKMALEEAFAPQLKSILSAKLKEEDVDDTDNAYEEDADEPGDSEESGIENPMGEGEEDIVADEDEEAGEDEEIEAVEEDVDITISDKPEDDPAFIDVEDKVEEPVEEPDEREEFGLDGADKTGRNRAYDDFQDIEKNILVAFDNLDNPSDIAMFEEYLLKNLALYFDKYEGELSVSPEEPTAAQDASPDEPADIAGDDEGDPETGIPDFELEEGMDINLESLIDKLLEQ